MENGLGGGCEGSGEEQQEWKQGKELGGYYKSSREEWSVQAVKCDFTRVFIMEGQTSRLTDRLDIRGKRKEVHLDYS